MSIASFADSASADLFHGITGAATTRHRPAQVRALRRALDLLDAAHALEDVRAARQLALRPLARRGAGWMTIRVATTRIKFRWSSGTVHEVAVGATRGRR